MQKTQGTPTKQKFDTETGDFEFKFIYNVNVLPDHPGIGYFSQEYYYPNCYDFTLKQGDTELRSPEDYMATKCDAENDVNKFYLSILNPNFDGKELTLNIKATPAPTE